MTIKKAIEITKHHQAWRRGAEIEMLSPREIGIAIDVLIEKVEGNSSLLIKKLDEAINQLKALNKCRCR